MLPITLTSWSSFFPIFVIRSIVNCLNLWTITDFRIKYSFITFINYYCVVIFKMYGFSSLKWYKNCLYQKKLNCFPKHFFKTRHIFKVENTHTRETTAFEKHASMQVNIELGPLQILPILLNMERESKINRYLSWQKKRLFDFN